MDALIYVDPGLESVAAEEVRELWPDSRAAPRGGAMSGRVRALLPACAELSRLRTAHHVVELLAEHETASLEDVRAAARALEVPALEQARSFRVTTQRVGRHEFKSEQVAGAVGAALQHRYKTRVDLRHFELEVRADLFGTRLYLGVQRTGRDLGKRIRRARVLRTALKATIAAAMIRLADAHRGRAELLCDPMCGSGTILVEAATINPSLRVFGADWDEPTVAAARGTLANHRLDVPVALADARTIARNIDQLIDVVVSDPPYGMRQGSRTRLDRFYESLLRGVLDALAPGARLVLISPRRKAMLSAIEALPLEVVDERPVETGGLVPRIWRLRTR